MSIFTVVVEQGVAVVTIDLPGSPVNILNAAAKREFEALLERLGGDRGVRAVVLLSGKAENFIAGADIEEFVALPDQAAAEALSRDGQAMLDRVAAFSKPIVAAIHGSCLGGGLELALACHYRIATNHPKTQLGLPEVQLGILPGAGGCQRLPRAIGVRAALDIILAGKSERASKAFKLGLVDELVPPALLRSVAVGAALRLLDAGLPRRAPRGPASRGSSSTATPWAAPWSTGWRASRSWPRPAGTTPRRSPPSRRSAPGWLTGCAPGWWTSTAASASSP